MTRTLYLPLTISIVLFAAATSNAQVHHQHAGESDSHHGHESHGHHGDTSISPLIDGGVAAHRDYHYGNADVHSHEHHAEYHSFDEIRSGRHHRHKTVDGIPFIHLLNTEHAFLDPKLQFAYAAANNADGGEVDEMEFETEFFWVVNSRLGVVAEVPLIALDPVDEPNTEGIGDLELGFQFIAFNGERTILASALNISTPTGDADRGLGSGHTALEPVAFIFHDFGGGNLFQGEFALEVPVDVPDPENEFHFNMGISHTFLSTESWRFFQYFSPLVEINGVTVLNGGERGNTVVNLTSGFRWVVRGGDQMGVGMSFPITGREEFDAAVILDYVLHF